MTQENAAKIEKVQESAPPKKNTPKKDSLSIDIAAKPTRVLPDLIDELLDKGFHIQLDKMGYKVHGFYGLKSALLQDTNVEGTFIVLDHKNKKHVIKSFKELVAFNNFMWKHFYKLPEYKKADDAWFKYLYDFGLLEITPSK